MAKFQNLTIQTAKIKGGAVTDYALATGTWGNSPGTASVSLTPTNPLGLPLQIYGRIYAQYRTLTTTAATSSVQLRRVRSGVSTVLWTQAVSDSGNTGGATRTQTFTCSYLEMSPVAGDQWQLYQASNNPVDAGLWQRNVELSVVWVKR